MNATPTRTDWPLIALLFLAGLFAAAQFAKISLALPAFARAYGRDLGEVAILVSALGTVGILLGVLAGMIVARFGDRRMLLLALLLGGIVSFAQASMPAFGPLLFSRVIEGISHLVIVIAAPTMMAGMARPVDQPVVMGLWGTFFGVSFAIAALVMPQIIATGGLSGLLLCHGAALWLVGVALLVRAPRTPTRTPRRIPGILQEHLSIYTTPRLLAPALGFVWYTLTFVALLTFVPLVPDTPSAALLPLLSLSGTMTAGILARSIPPGRIVLAGFGLVFVVAVLLVIGPSALHFFLICTLFSVVGLIPGASFAAIPALNTNPEDRARAGGAIAQLGNVGTTLGTPLFAAVFWAGLDGLMVLTAWLALCGASCVVFIHRKIGAEV